MFKRDEIIAASVLVGTGATLLAGIAHDAGLKGMCTALVVTSAWSLCVAFLAYLDHPKK